MRTAPALAAAALLSAAFAAPAAAQSDGEQILQNVLRGLLAPPPGATNPAAGPQSGGVRFLLTDLREDDVCEMVFTGSGSGAVQPGQSCPGALATAGRWAQSGDDLELRDGFNRIVWRGERNPDGAGWTGGAADTLRVYSIAPGGPVGGAAAPAFDPATVYGGWRMAEPGQTFGCRVTFVAPDPDNRFARADAINTEAGCPGSVFGASRWVHVDGQLVLTDGYGNLRAQLQQTSADRWVGKSGEVDVVMTRL